MVEKIKDVLAFLATRTVFLLIIAILWIIHLLSKIQGLKEVLQNMVARRTIDEELDKLKELDSEANKSEDKYNADRNAFKPDSTSGN